MNKFALYGNYILQQRDVLLVLVFALILLMILIPLPSLLMDIFITINISASIIILMMMLQLHEPVQFSTFPSVLLVTTLFRLAISISTTRLILVEGDAGQIVETFGTVVTGGNLVVGLVMFMIITVVQFMVITKGADRVAEVGARFTLDAMPGKQMSVDADVRAGMIDQADAKQRRQILERESKLFGAMDGAMKFVKGDATAGLIITAINLIGGMAIGVAQLGMEFNEAITLYSNLTIGDGLVAQIPALLISVASGTLVTRVINPDGIDLGAEISTQITENRRTIMIGGVVIGCFGFVPGFPTVIFLIVGGGMAFSAYRQGQIKEVQVIRKFESWMEVFDELTIKWDVMKKEKGIMETVRLVMPRNIMENTNPLEFMEVFEFTRQTLEKRYGLPMGYWRWEFRKDDDNVFEIFVKQHLILKDRIKSNHFVVKANKSYMDLLGIPSDVHFGDRECVLVHYDHFDKLLEEKIVPCAIEMQLCILISDSVTNNLRYVCNFSGATAYLVAQSNEHPELINNIKDNTPLSLVTKILQYLVEEQIPLVRGAVILEGITNATAKTVDPLEALQKVRISLKNFITETYAPEKLLNVVIISPTLEGMLRESFRTGNEDAFLVLEPRLSTKIAQEAYKRIDGRYTPGVHPVLITQQDIRRSIFNILAQHNIFMPVVCYQEITTDTIIYPVGYISEEETAA